MQAEANLKDSELPSFIWAAAEDWLRSGAQRPARENKFSLLSGCVRLRPSESQAWHLAVQPSSFREPMSLTPRGAVFLLVLPTAAFAVEQKRADSKQAEPENSGRSIWTQNVTGFRKEHGAIGGYKKRWYLGDLPHYAPKQKLTGTLRIWSTNYLKDGELAKTWAEEFKKFQPGVTLEYQLPTGAIAVSAVATGVADLGMNAKATLTDRLVFEQVFHHPLTEITAVTGSFDVYGWAPAGIIVVHKDNPLTQISMKQLDGVFGGARLGGYVGSVWHTEYPYARGPEENIRTWGQLGLTGEWADKPIHVGGENLGLGGVAR